MNNKYYLMKTCFVAAFSELFVDSICPMHELKFQDIRGELFFYMYYMSFPHKLLQHTLWYIFHFIILVAATACACIILLFEYHKAIINICDGSVLIWTVDKCAAM